MGVHDLLFLDSTPEIKAVVKKLSKERQYSPDFSYGKAYQLLFDEMEAACAKEVTPFLSRYARAFYHNNNGVLEYNYQQVEDVILDSKPGEKREERVRHRLSLSVKPDQDVMSPYEAGGARAR